VVDAIKTWAKDHLLITSIILSVVGCALFVLGIVFVPAVIILLIGVGIVGAVAAGIYVTLMDSRAFETKEQKMRRERQERELEIQLLRTEQTLRELEERAGKW
jgi:mannose/fructose/N-acetylgalactosamine-specific phosphotransferase system component IIC